MRCKLACSKIMLPLCFLFSLSSCYKLQDYIHHPGSTTYDDCSIKKIDCIFPGYTITYTFSYNKSGHPISMLNPAAGTGNPNYYFTYDKKNRLTQLLRSYTTGLYEQWFKYGYNSKGQIAYDTIYTFGRMSGSTPLPTTDKIIFTRYDYDADGRIVHTRADQLTGNTVSFAYENNYDYDNNGNLVTYPATIYDNKLNLKRTSAVWMFITKDYSANNPFTATSYNASSLPLNFAHTDLVPIPTQNVSVTYTCK